MAFGLRWIAAALTLLPGGVALAQAASPFQGFETRILPNGLKVWFKPAPGFSDVSVSIAVPTGADQDPVGKEQLAHFTEHMLFTDRAGRTEEQIKKALEDRGGIRNGVTTWDHTFYYARVGREHGLFAIEWLYGIIAPREMAAPLVDRQRVPVLLELGASRRTFGDLLRARLIDPPALRTPDVWARDFGIRTLSTRDYDPWRSIHAITPSDLQGFYAAHYAPSRLTLTVIGNLPRDSVWRAIERTFGTLPAGQPAEVADVETNLDRPRRSFWWSFRSDVSYSDRYKERPRTPRDYLLSIFLADYLSRELNEDLRYGERKAVYGIGAYLVRRGPGAMFQISSQRVKKEELAFARARIDSAVERLRSGRIADTAFVQRRDAIASQLRVSTNSAAALEDWVWDYFYDRRVFHDFPDVAGEFARLSKAEVVGFASQLFAPQRRVFGLEQPIPLQRAIAGGVAAALLLLLMRVARWTLLRPLPMARLRYVTRIRRSFAERLALAGAAALVTAVAIRLLVYVFQLFNDRFLLSIDSFVVQAMLFGAQGSVVVLALFWALARIPVKVLVFEDGFAIKYLAYRSRFIPMDDVLEITLHELIDLGAIAAVLRTRFLGLSLQGSVVIIRLRDGRAYSINARDPEELYLVLKRVQGVMAPAISLATAAPAAFTKPF